MSSVTYGTLGRQSVRYAVHTVADVLSTRRGTGPSAARECADVGVVAKPRYIQHFGDQRNLVDFVPSGVGHPSNARGAGAVDGRGWVGHRP